MLATVPGEGHRIPGCCYSCNLAKLTVAILPFRLWVPILQPQLFQAFVTMCRLGGCDAGAVQQGPQHLAVPWPLLCAVYRPAISASGLPVCLLAAPSICLSACLLVCLSVCLSARPLVCPFVCLLVCLPVCPPASLSICLSVCLSVCLSGHYLSFCLTFCLLAGRVVAFHR